MAFQYCPQCGSKLQPGFKFCPSCGEKIPNLVDFPETELSGISNAVRKLSTQVELKTQDITLT
ncbi:hypothetical protein C0J45_24291, partial [Silurus meridionalis]